MSFILEEENPTPALNNSQTPGGEEVLAESVGSLEEGPQSIQTNNAGANPQAQTTGTGWSNLQNYLTANEGADTRMGGQVATHVGDEAADAAQKRDEWGESLEKEIADNTITPDQQMIADLKAGRAVDPNNFEKSYNADWQGPENAASFGDWGSINQQLGNVGKQVKNTGSHTGRTQLAADTFTKGYENDYTQGMKGLDAFLLGSGEGGRSAMQGIRDQHSDLTDQWTDYTNQMDDQVSQGRDQTIQGQQQTAEAYGQGWNTLRGQLENAQGRIPQAEQQLQAERAQLMTGLKSEDPRVRNNAYDALGIDRQVGEGMFRAGIDFEVPEGTGAGLGDVMSQSEIDNYLNFAGLTGTDPGYEFNRGRGYNPINSSVDHILDGLLPHIPTPAPAKPVPVTPTPPLPVGHTNPSPGREFDDRDEIFA